MNFVAGIGVTRAEIANLFKILEYDIINSLNSQMDILQVGENEEFEEISFPLFQKKHLAIDCPLGDSQFVVYVT